MAEFSTSAAEFVPGGQNRIAPGTVAKEFVPRGADAQKWSRQGEAVHEAQDAQIQGAYGEEYNSGYGLDSQGGADTVPDMMWAEGLPDSTMPAPPKRSLQTIGIPAPIRHHFRTLDQTSLKQMEPNDDRYKELPNRFHSAYPLDDSYSFSPQQRGIGGSYGYPSAVYKVIDKTDGQIYALRRVDNLRLSANTSHMAMHVARKWSDVRHPAIVSLYSISIERNAAFFNHAYHPGAQTLRQRYIDNRDDTLQEPLIWRIVVQLMSGIRLAHQRGLAMRNVSATHVILTSGTVARFTGSGILDVLEADSRKSVAEMQAEDLLKMGYLVLGLVARHVTTPKNAEQALRALAQNFSQDLQRLVGALLSGNTNIGQVSNLISDHVHDELDQSMAAADALHNHLRGEFESSRFMRLMFKLQHVNERPEFFRDSQWSETGDRYLLKLFRDYVFHQTHADSGAPILDSGHVITALNKLDCGDPERILLSSRDNKDLLIVSFADVKRCLDAAFEELSVEADRYTPMGQGGNRGGVTGGGGGMMPGGLPRGTMGMGVGGAPPSGNMAAGPVGYHNQGGYQGY